MLALSTDEKGARKHFAVLILVEPRALDIEQTKTATPKNILHDDVLEQSSHGRSGWPKRFGG